MTWTRTDYFSYFTDGASQTTHRSGDQVWNFTYPGDHRAYAIWTSGNNPQNGQHNAFAKKHLLTVRGGKTDDVDQKLGTLHENRQAYEIDTYTAERARKQARLSAPNRAQYPINALGGQAMNANAQGQQTNTLSVVICDRIAPEKLKNAFAKALSKAGLVANAAKHNIVVSFGDNNCVCRHDFLSNTSEYVNQITVTAYCVSISANSCTAHIVHCSG